MLARDMLTRQIPAGRLPAPSICNEWAGIPVRRVQSATLRLRGRRSVLFLLHLTTEEIVQCRSDDGYRPKFADCIPAWGHCRGKDVGAQLKLQSNGQKPRKRETRVGEVPRCRRKWAARKAQAGKDHPNADNHSANCFNDEFQPQNEVAREFPQRQPRMVAQSFVQTAENRQHNRTRLTSPLASMQPAGT